MKKTFIFSLFVFFAFLSTSAVTLRAPVPRQTIFNLYIFHCLFCFDFRSGYDLHFTIHKNNNNEVEKVFI